MSTTSSKRITDAHDRWLAWSADRYGILLILLVINYATLILLADGVLASLVGALTISVTAVFAVDVSKASRRVRIIVRCMVLTVPVMFILYDVLPSETRALLYLTFAIVLAATPVLVLLRIVGHEKVDMATLLAALDIYILIGLIFSLFYIGCSHLAGASPFFAQPGHKDRSDFVYFSYIVLTTVGFGDLTPVSKVARTLVVTEALIGQVFLVTAVARVVALFGSAQFVAGTRKARSEVDAENAD